MKANAVPLLLSSLVRINHYIECNEWQVSWNSWYIDVIAKWKGILLTFMWWHGITLIYFSHDEWLFLSSILFRLNSKVYFIQWSYVNWIGSFPLAAQIVQGSQVCPLLYKSKLHGSLFFAVLSCPSYFCRVLWETSKQGYN